jgi:hypothetical protein
VQGAAIALAPHLAYINKVSLADGAAPRQHNTLWGVTFPQFDVRRNV